MLERFNITWNPDSKPCPDDEPIPRVPKQDFQPSLPTTLLRRRRQVSSQGLADSFHQTGRQLLAQVRNLH